MHIFHLHRSGSNPGDLSDAQNLHNSFLQVSEKYVVGFFFQLLHYLFYFKELYINTCFTNPSSITSP